LSVDFAVSATAPPRVTRRGTSPSIFGTSMDASIVPWPRSWRSTLYAVAYISTLAPRTNHASMANTTPIEPYSAEDAATIRGT